MRNGLWKCSFVTLTVFATVFLFFAPLWGSDWAVSPRIEILEEYNDNILFFRKGQELDDWVTYVRPRVEGTYRTEKFRLSLDSGLSIEKYIDYDELDTTNHRHRLALSYALSRTLSLRTGGYFGEDTTLETELIEEGLWARREDRRQLGGNLGFNYVFSTRVFLSGDWTRRYSEYPDDPLDYDDRLSDTLELVPQYVLSPKTSLFLNMVYTKTEYDSEGDPTIENYDIRPSFRHDFAEHSYISGGAGYRYTKGQREGADDDTGSFVFDLSFHKNWKKLSIDLLAGSDQYSSVDMRSIWRHWLTLRGAYRLSARLRTSIATTFRTNRVDKGGDDSNYFVVTPALSYNFTPTIALRGSVDYSQYNYDEDIDRDRDRERFRARLTLNFNWPRLLSGK